MPLFVLLASWLLLVLAVFGRRAEAEAVLGDALGGHPQAIRALIEGLGPVVRARVRRVLSRNPARVPCMGQDVDELIQETFLVLFADDSSLLRRWDPERGMSLPNYVGQIAEREAGRYLRARSAAKRKGEELTAPDDLTMQRAPDGGTAADEQLEQDERRRDLLGRVREALTPESFLVFDLLYVRLLSAPEVAQMLGCEVQAVYTRRSRIRTTLRKLVEEMDAGESTAPA